MKTALVLFNLGGPDGPEAVKPFLINLFNDPAILRLPFPMRPIVARLIANRRTKTATDIYARIGGRSPILENTQAQARALEKEFVGGCGETKCFVAMRYWHPFAHEVAQAVKNFKPDRLILLPLYPQFSTATTASSLKSWNEAARKTKLEAPAATICCYPEEPDFIAAMADLTRPLCQAAKPYGKPRLLFSAHGLPEKIVKAGDPYPFQCRLTARALAKELGLAENDWVLCYQSRVGPLRWIGPQTDDEIRRAGRDGIPLVVVPITFVSEHSETLVELDIFYRELAAKAGVPYFGRAAAAGTAPLFIKALAGLARGALREPPACQRICPPVLSGCFRTVETQTKDSSHAL